MLTDALYFSAVLQVRLNIVKNIPGEVDGKGGGDDTVEMQSVERQWIRMQAAKYL